MANRPSSLADRCLPAFSILDNYLNQNPCEIARELIDRCDGQQQQYYDLAPLDLINNIRSYRSPNPGQATSCLCSMGVYNLIQGCAACQQEGRYNASLWTNWVSNCTMSNINGQATFPYPIPSDTALPDWACANNAGGSLSVGNVFKHITGYNQTSSTSSTAASTGTSSSAQTGTRAQETDSLSGPHPYGVKSSGGTTKIVAIAVPIVVVAALLAGVLAYLRKKRKFRNRGHRLDSSANLATGGAGAFGVGSQTTSIGYFGGSMMKQKGDSRGVSIFSAAPTGQTDESVFTRSGSRRSRGGRSIGTNSVSTRQTGGVAGDAFLDHHRASTLYSSSSPTSGFDTITQSSVGEYSYDSASASEEDGDGADDDERSPFTNSARVARPPPSRVTTRSNIHTAPSFSHSSSSSSSRYPRRQPSISTFGSASIHLSEADSASEREDGESLRSVASSGRRPPSSSGATYGGWHEEEEDYSGSGSEGEDRRSTRS